MKKRVSILVLVLIVLSSIVCAVPPQPPAAPPKPNINFPDDQPAVGTAGSGGGGGGDPYDPFAGGGSRAANRTNSTVPGTYDDWGLDGTMPRQPAAQPRTTPSASPAPATQPRTPALEPDAESEGPSFWIMALIAGAGIIVIIMVVVGITFFMKNKTVPDSLKSYIKYNLQMGYRMDALEPLLLSVGWSKEQIKKAYIEVLGQNQSI